MALDRNARDLRSLRVLLHDRGWANLEEAIEGPERARLLCEGIQHFARTQHLSESDRLLLTLAYSLWRGFGPSFDVKRDVVMGHEFCAEIIEHGPGTV